MNSQPSPPVSAVESAGSANAVPGRPSELRFLLPEERTNFRTLFGGAGAAHVTFILLLFFIAWLRPDRQVRAVLPDLDPTNLIFIEQPGPGGGGGGGGNKSPEPPKTVETPPIKPPEPKPEPIPIPDPVPPPEPVVAAEIPAISPITTPAVVASTTNIAPPSLGTGNNTGAGTGDGGGIGPGKGDGLGPGSGGNEGGGVFQVGNGVLPPVSLYTPKPAYTSEAMLRRIQGDVDLDCVVQADGTVGKCDIVKSLDSNQFGLDNEALKAARQFRFKPGTRRGEPVAVLVRIILTFNMR
jgi:TonB family protein